MQSVTIRNLDPSMLRWLRERAKSHGRSLNSEFLDLLRTVHADEMALAAADHPLARSYLEARRRGIRTPSTAAKDLRMMRDTRR